MNFIGVSIPVMAKVDNLSEPGHVVAIRAGDLGYLVRDFEDREYWAARYELEGMPGDSALDTLEHVLQVRRRLDQIVLELVQRGVRHDASKLEEPERRGYGRLATQLADVQYGSDAYRAALDEARDVIAHHYAHNRHHPEHWPVPDTPQIAADRANLVFAEERYEALYQHSVRLRRLADMGVPLLSGWARRRWEACAMDANCAQGYAHLLRQRLQTAESRIHGMSLLDLVEMLADWKAASARTKQGSIAASLEHNRKRFGVSEQLARILENTVRELGW